ncbi:fibulin-5 [Plakobranchus ocellatus]|uniref:Fibulin-5 n=1 Tax=Plakobranchus ocellatus TaxID=259542 RepID=A0AAV4CTC6_9GAST|nr:fibulin-5 [Plakobranchus ocellatus]
MWVCLKIYPDIADADLCDSSPCEGSCSETEDGMDIICSCNPGQILADDGFSCIDADLCASSPCGGSCNETADGTNVICSCNPGQTLADDGFSCFDEDECATSTHSCEDICINTEGSYICSCNIGRELEDDNTNCYDALKTNSTLTFRNIDVSSVNFADKQGNVYRNVLELVQSELLAHFSKISGVTKVIVNEIRPGSLIVDFTTIFNTETTADAGNKMIDALIFLTTDGITINETFTNVEAQVGSINDGDYCIADVDVTIYDDNSNYSPACSSTVTSNTDKCSLLAEVDACEANETCLISAAGSAYCSK